MPEPDLTNLNTVRDLLSRHNFHTSKKLGQNFIVNPNICPKIAAEGLADEYHGVLEIGPGIGTLTQALVQNANRVVSMELDTRLIPILNETIGTRENFHLLHGDILKTDLTALWKEEFSNLPVVVCANLPYYITTPILMHLLESDADIQAITVMVQKEVATKLTAEVGTREAGAITAAVQYYGTAKILFPVSRTSFFPVPNVDSAVLQIVPEKRYANQIRDEKHFFRMIRCGFSQRRKTLVNTLSGTMGYPKEELAETLKMLGLSEMVRFEALSMAELISLSNALTT